MKHLLFLLLVCSTTLCLGQPYQRLNGETIEAFVMRITESSRLAHPVIETNEWDSTHKSAIYFLPVPTPEGPALIGYVLVPLSMTKYRRVLIDTFFQEGGDPKIETIFFANSDKDKEKELVILTSWPQNHSGAGLVGTLYGTFIFDNPSPSVQEYQL
jgi:hypothetical protein